MSVAGVTILTRKGETRNVGVVKLDRRHKIMKVRKSEKMRIRIYTETTMLEEVKMKRVQGMEKQ